MFLDCFSRSPIVHQAPGRANTARMERQAGWICWSALNPVPTGMNTQSVGEEKNWAGGKQREWPSGAGEWMGARRTGPIPAGKKTKLPGTGTVVFFEGLRLILKLRPGGRRCIALSVVKVVIHGSLKNPWPSSPVGFSFSQSLLASFFLGTAVMTRLTVSMTPFAPWGYGEGGCIGAVESRDWRGILQKHRSCTVCKWFTWRTACETVSRIPGQNRNFAVSPSCQGP